MGPAIGLAIAEFAATYPIAFAIIRTILVNVLVGALQRASQDSSRKNLPPINVTIRDPVENGRIIFGRVRAGAFIDPVPHG